LMYEDGAGRKVERLNRLVELVRSRSGKGISLDELKTIAERKLGLSPKRVESYIRLLGRTREIEVKRLRVYIREENK